MANLFHPISSDHEPPRSPDDLPSARSAKRRGTRASSSRRRLARMLLVAAIVGVLCLLTTMPRLIGPTNELAGVAASLSGAAPTQAASGAGASYDNGPTGYFPDRFTVKRWDERPAPEQF